MSSFKRLIPTLNRILVEKIVASSKTTAGILLPESSTKLNSGKVIAVGPGIRTNNGNLIPTSLKEGDTVLLPEYGGTEFKLLDKTNYRPPKVSFYLIAIVHVRGVWLDVITMYHLYREDDILGTLHN